MAFITDSNARQIIQKTEINSVQLNGEIYQKRIYFFSDYEIKQLLAYKQLIKSTEVFVKETYSPIELKKDSYSLVYEYDDKKPAFHKNLECSHLNRNYENFTIPDDIRFKSNGQLDFANIHKFRKWFPEVEHLFKNDKEAFVFRLKQRFGVTTNPQALEALNSGALELVNYNLKELTDRIEMGIKQAGRYYYNNLKNTTILKRFSKWSYLGFSDKPLRKNDTGYTDDVVKEFLRDYDTTIKKPLKILLREYYRIQYNTNLDFKEELLIALNFKPCSKCYDDFESTKEIIDPNVGQFKEHDTIIKYINEKEFFKEYMTSFDEIIKKDYHS